MQTRLLKYFFAPSIVPRLRTPQHGGFMFNRHILTFALTFSLICPGLLARQRGKSSVRSKGTFITEIVVIGNGTGSLKCIFTVYDLSPVIGKVVRKKTPMPHNYPPEWNAQLYAAQLSNGGETTVITRFKNLVMLKEQLNTIARTPAYNTTLTINRDDTFTIHTQKLDDQHLEGQLSVIVSVTMSKIGSYTGTEIATVSKVDGGADNIRWVFPVDIDYNAEVTSKSRTSPGPDEIPPKPPVVAPDGSICIQDDKTGDSLTFNPESGFFRYTECNSNIQFTGTGSVERSGCTIKLNHSRLGLEVTVACDLCNNTASVVTTRIGSTHTITDSNTKDSSCRCK